MKLEDIAIVLIGVLTSRELNQLGEYEYKVFNLKNYDLQEKYETVKSSKNLENKLTKKGDILVRLNYPNKVIYVNENMENLLVPSQMCLIRPNVEKINPKFLKWYLASDIGEQRMSLDVTGSIIPKISVASLRKLDIPIINIEKQKAITDLIELWNKERNVLQEIIKEKDLLYNSIINQIIEKEG